MMAAVSQVPPPAKLMWPMLRALKELGGSATNDELLKKIIEIDQIPAEVQAVLSPWGRSTRLDFNLRWAKVDLRKVGAIDSSSRGVWSVTEEGRRLSEEDVREVPRRAQKLFSQDRQAMPAGSHPDSGSDQAVGEETIQSEEANWKDRLLVILRELKPEVFERLAQRILREAGFVSVEVTGRGGDGGIDGIGVLRVNLLSFHVLFQCKRYQGSVGAGAIRDFRGAMVGRSDKGLVITTGTFTADAKKEAARDGAPAIDLIDGDKLCDLLKQLRLGVRTEMVERALVDPAFFDAI